MRKIGAAKQAPSARIDDLTNDDEICDLFNKKYIYITLYLIMMMR